MNAEIIKRFREAMENYSNGAENSMDRLFAFITGHSKAMLAALERLQTIDESKHTITTQHGMFVNDGSDELPRLRALLEIADGYLDGMHSTRALVQAVGKAKKPTKRIGEE